MATASPVKLETVGVASPAVLLALEEPEVGDGLDLLWVAATEATEAAEAEAAGRRGLAALQ